MSDPMTGKHGASWSTAVGCAILGVVFAVIFTLAGTNAASARYLKVPGVAGSSADAAYLQWIKVEARDWMGVQPRQRYNLGIGNSYVSGPAAPLPGKPNKLVVTLDKKSPELKGLMALCASKTVLPEMSYAEPATSKHPKFPAFFEYRLKDAQIVGCDSVPEAAQQALIISFQDIEWLNYDPKGPLGYEVVNKAAEIPNIFPAADDGHKKAFVVTWFGWATLGDDSTCPVMNSKPPESEYYALLPKEEADAERKRRGEKGVSFGNDPNPPFMGARGPHRLDVCAMPGIVRDPGHAEPQTKVALGVNLDGNDGTGAPAPGTCKHGNFMAEDGSINGVDNQLYRVYGCIPGFRGKKGYMNQTHNARRADGNVVSIIEISGIDNPKNDDRVEIRILNAKDKPIRAVNGDFVANYTYRMTDDPNFARYNALYIGKIVNGYVVTPSMKEFVFHNGQGGIVHLSDAQIRLKIMPDGKLKGVVGGYQGAGGPASSYTEGLFNFSCPGMYNSFLRNADGKKDPVTGKCTAISMAYEVDAVPAFITPLTAPRIAQNIVATKKAP